MGEHRYGILDAERELIAAILADNRCYRAVEHLLKPEHFLAPAHRHQFAAIGRAVRDGRPIGPDLPAEDAGRPLIGPPAIDPLDHALMIYGSQEKWESMAPGDWPEAARIAVSGAPS